MNGGSRHLPVLELKHGRLVNIGFVALVRRMHAAYSPVPILCQGANAIEDDLANAMVVYALLR